MALNEIELLNKCLKGDTKAFEAIVADYQDLVCAITYSGVADIHRSEELAQQTFINAWNKLSQLKDLSKFRPWLCSIARNLVKSFIRTKKRDIIAKAKPMENINDTAAEQSDPLESAIKKEHQQLVNDAIEQIPDQYRETVVLYYRKHLTVKQIAEMLDLSEDVTYKRLQRGRKMIKAQLDSIFEKTLSGTGPKKAFTASVMASVAGIALKGTAAAAAGTAATTTGGTTATAATITTVMSGVTAKIITAAAVVITAAAVTVYSYNVSKQQPKNEPQEPVAKVTQNNNSGVVENSQVADTAGKISGQDSSTVNQSNPVNTESQAVSNKSALRSTRHPDWPTLQEKVQNYYMRNGGNQMWIRLPRHFRDENNKEILIDNGKERIEVNKDKKNIRYSDTLNAGDKPIRHYGSTLAGMDQVQIAYVFGRSGNPVADSQYNENYTVEEIGQEDDGSLLIFKLKPANNNNDNSEFEAKVYVDAATMLPEKIALIGNDPNSETYGQEEDAFLFDFSAISDSMFEYTVKADEKVLPFKQHPCFRGKVVDVMGEPVSGADVFIHYFPVSGDYLTCKSDPNGNFEIKLPNKPGQNNVFLPVKFWATMADNPDLAGWTLLETEHNLDFQEAGDFIPGYGGDIIQSDSEPSYQQTIVDGVEVKKECISRIQANPVIGNIVLVMEPTGVINGTVTDKNGKAIAGAKLNAGFAAKSKRNGLSFYSNQKGWDFEAVSDANGYYEIRGLPALWKGCDYTFHISAKGFVAEYKRFETKKPLDLKSYNIKLNRQLVTISGILKDDHGVPLAGRTVSYSAAKINASYCSTTTDPNGIFVLQGCPDAAGLTVSASLSSSYPEGNIGATKEKREAFLYYPRVSQKIVHVPGKSEYFVELTAVRPRTKVEVLVTDSAGNPLDEFKVKLDGRLKSEHPEFKGGFISYPWQHMKLEKRTDKNGKITFGNVPDLGEMTIIVSADLSFTRELHALNGKQKEKKRLDKIDRAYSKTYQKMEIPVKLVEGQTDYSVHAVVLTKVCN